MSVRGAADRERHGGPGQAPILTTKPRGAETAVTPSRARRSVWTVTSPPSPESPPCRLHRFALRTADRVDLMLLHAQALDELEVRDRVALLGTLTSVLVSGRRVTVADSLKIARRFVLAEKRQPGAVLFALEDGLRERLAVAFLRQSGTPVLLEGYQRWNGREPAPLSPGLATVSGRLSSGEERRLRLAQLEAAGDGYGAGLGGGFI